MDVKQQRTQNLIEGLCEGVQALYDSGEYISQDTVHESAETLFREDPTLVALIEEDDVYDFLIDNVINQVSINLW